MLTGVQLGFPLPPAFFLAGMPVETRGVRAKSTAAKPKFGELRQRTVVCEGGPTFPVSSSAIQHLTVDGSAGQVLRRHHLELHPLGDPRRVDAPRLLAVAHERLDGDLG